MNSLLTDLHDYAGSEADFSAYLLRYAACARTEPTHEFFGLTARALDYLELRLGVGTPGEVEELELDLALILNSRCDGVPIGKLVATAPWEGTPTLVIRRLRNTLKEWLKLNALNVERKRKVYRKSRPNKRDASASAKSPKGVN